MVQHVVVVGFGLTAAIVYACGKGYAVYPITALGILVVWETLGWEGAASAVAITTTGLAMAAALGWRITRHRPAVSPMQPPREALLLAWGLLALWIVVALALDFVVDGA